MQAFDLVNREIFSVKTGKLGLTAGREGGRGGAGRAGKGSWEKIFSLRSGIPSY